MIFSMYFAGRHALGFLTITRRDPVVQDSIWYGPEPTLFSDSQFVAVSVLAASAASVAPCAVAVCLSSTEKCPSTNCRRNDTSGVFKVTTTVAGSGVATVAIGPARYDGGPARFFSR